MRFSIGHAVKTGMVVLGVTITTPAVPSAAAGPTMCSTVLANLTVNQVVVPGGAVCTLQESIVGGDVRVLPGGTAFLDRTKVSGNIVGHDVNRLFVGRTDVGGNVAVHGGQVVGLPGATVAVCATRVQGNLTVHEVTGGIGLRPFIPGLDPPGGFSAQCGLVPNEVGGNLIVSDNRSIRLVVQDNMVEGNVLVAANRGEGVKAVMRNEASGVLACAENDDPFTALDNVAVKATGQCA